MKAILIKNPGIILLCALTLTQTGCRDKDKDDSSPYMVKLATSTTLGEYLADKDGRTLYIFANDANGRTSCTGACSSLWPYFYVDGLTLNQIGPGLSLSDFDTIHVNGTNQLRFRTWPLYYYAPLIGNINTLEPAGQTNGDGFAGIWFVAKPNYSIMLANAQLVGNDGKNYTAAHIEGIGKTIYFTDGRGVSLYTFSKDSLKRNKFTKPDLSNNGVWPMYESSNNVVPSNLDKTLFDSIKVSGRTQLTYKGWPLYYFGQDLQVRGNNKGVSFPTPGVWPIGNKDLPTAPQN